MGVAINPPKTPVTEGSNGVAMATVPNVCKMPGPPAPFVPTPLPNIGKSNNSPNGYSTTVTIEGNAVAIKGATFNSIGDVASQGTGGGIVSSNVQGPTSFVGPGSLDVTIEGKAVQLLTDPMLNNGGPSGSPANAATMMGIVQNGGGPVVTTPVSPECQEAGDKIHDVVHGNPARGGAHGYKSMGQRAAELKSNPGNQPMFWSEANPGVPRPRGSDQWGHLIQIEQQQTELNTAIQAYHENGCNHLDQATMDAASEFSMADPMDML